MQPAAALTPRSMMKIKRDLLVVRMRPCEHFPEVFQLDDKQILALKSRFFEH